MKIFINKSEIASYRKDMDGLTFSLSSILNDIVNDLNYIRYHFEDEEGIEDTNFDKISSSEYENMLDKLKDYKQYSMYMHREISAINRKFTDAIE